MKIAGEEINGQNEDILVLPRAKKPIVFRGRAVKDYDTFNKLCPLPQPPGVLTSKGFIPDKDDAGYKAIMANYSLQRLAWVAITTLEPSNIEWDTVVVDNPATWMNWAEDLQKAGFSAVEQNHILEFVLDVNCLTEKKMEQARADFLRGQAAE